MDASCMPTSITAGSLHSHRRLGRQLRRSPAPAPGRRCRARRTSPIVSVTHPLDALTSAARLLWGRGLPPSPLVSAARSTWSATWHLMMRQLAPPDPAVPGAFARVPSRFPSVPSDYRNPHPNPSLKNLHLYVGLPCPWAHRVLIVRALKNLEPLIPVSVATPGDDGSWVFSPLDNNTSDDSKTYGVQDGMLVPGVDHAHGKSTLREVYQLRKGGYDGRSTVPMLWDAERKEVVCNESYSIIEFFNSFYGEGHGPDLFPQELASEITKWNNIIYPNVNNGVYRCGFAQSQEAYSDAVNELFDTLDKLDAHLATSRYLCGSSLTLADICLFTTLIRFDLVYNGIFKCTKRKLVEYMNLHDYMLDIYQIPKVANTCNLEAIMDGYYKTLFPLNPGGIRPATPSVCERKSLLKTHKRESLFLVRKQAMPS